MVNSQRESRELDDVDVKDLLPTCLKCLTTTQADYVWHTDAERAAACAKKQQTDESLITGHYKNNLKVKGQEMKTRTWPRAMDWREEYSQFVKRLKWCNEETFKLFFKCPLVRYDIAEQFLKDLHKTIYMMDYSPKDYASLFSQKRISLNELEMMAKNSKFASKDYQTTYGNYYNRIQEVERFRSCLYNPPPPKDISKETFDREMRKLFKKYDLTTYYDEICVPALAVAKDGIMPTGPIDRYTLRKY